MRWFEVWFQRFLQVGDSFFFGLALAGDIDFEALRDIPIPLAPDGSSKRSLQGDILSQQEWGRHICCYGASQLILTRDSCHRRGQCASEVQTP